MTRMQGDPAKCSACTLLKKLRPTAVGCFTKFLRRKPFIGFCRTDLKLKILLTTNGSSINIIQKFTIQKFWKAKKNVYQLIIKKSVC